MCFFFWGGKKWNGNGLGRFSTIWVATCMEIYLNTSSLYSYGIDENQIWGLGGFFSFQHQDLDEGMKYLGFTLRPNFDQK